jgi:hypothetical protein
MQLHQTLDWTPVPAEMQARLLEYQSTAPNMWAEAEITRVGRWMERYGAYETPKWFEEWARANLPITDTWVVQLQSVFPRGMIVHTDFFRDTAALFMLTDDGATTHWHDEDRNIIESTRLASHQWVQIRNDVPHSVSGVQGVRVAVCVFEHKPEIKGKTYFDPALAKNLPEGIDK